MARSLVKDPYEYFRIEAREILEGLGRGVLQIEKGSTPELVAALLRMAHTIKGAARVVRQGEIAEHAHAIEDILAPLRDPTRRMPPERIDEALKLLDAMSARVAALDVPQNRPAAGPQPAAGTNQPALADDILPTVRADVADMDALLDGLCEASVQVRALRRISVTAERARHLTERLMLQIAPVRAIGGADVIGGSGAGRLRALAEEVRALTATLEQSITNGVDQAERQLRQVRDAAERLRLLPASALFASLERTARDDARALGKQVSFQAKGGETRIDAQVMGVVQAALIQMVRNAVAHGIETKPERASARKTPVGRVDVEVTRRGNRVAFTCRDDGRGIDVDAIRRAAESKGLLSPARQGVEVEELFQLLLKGGLTTSSQVTETSGRGIGLDIVRQAATQLGGEITARTAAGQGTSIELCVPASLASVDALLVEAGGVAAAIPIGAVRKTLRLNRGDVVRAPGGDSIVHGGQVIPFVALAGPLGGKANRREVDTWTAVVVAGNSALAAVGVDRLFGTANVVIRPLPPLTPADPMVAGATLDAEGTPQLVLDPVGLVAAAGRAGSPGGAPGSRPRPVVLVIDDSLTTRMLEQSILESAGYEVDLATSAEEGLEMARRRIYRLFLVDVEMPGMDGFEFVGKTRADPVLREIPAILVTSRNADEDRRRGVAAGAHAYVVKSDFNQGQLLDIIRKLVE